MNEAFNKWWDSDELVENNPFNTDTAMFWAWEGWQAALTNPKETVTFGLSTCPQCGKANPAEIHTCTPKQQEPYRCHWVEKGHGHCERNIRMGWSKDALPQREWQWLTDEEREEATGWSVEHIEAKLKEKNT